MTENVAMKSSQMCLAIAVVVVFSFLFLFLSREPLQAEGRRPPAWDYKVVAIEPINNEEMQSKLQAAGAEGWDCISTRFIDRSGTSVGVYLVLKRPK
jgi:hypothetical protein